MRLQQVKLILFDTFYYGLGLNAIVLMYFFLFEFIVRSFTTKSTFANEIRIAIDRNAANKLKNAIEEEAVIMNSIKNAVGNLLEAVIVEVVAKLNVARNIVA